METQETINEWAEATFGPIDARGAFLRCADEFAELARVFGLDGLAADMMFRLQEARALPGRTLATEDESKARIECADVLITLYRVAEVLRGDLHWGVDDKMKINRAREWRIVGPGIGQHV